MPNEDEMTSIEDELQALEEKLLAEDEDEAEPEVKTEVKEEAKVETKEEVKDPTEFNDMVPAVRSALANMTPEKRAEALKDWQESVKQEKEQEVQQVAKGAVKKTTSDMLEAARSRVPAELLPEDFDDAEPHEQMFVLNEILSDLKSEEKSQAAIAPYKQRDAQEAHQQKLMATADGWAKELGKPEAAEAIYGFIGSAPPEIVAIYEKEMEQGGGMVSFLVGEHVKRMVSEMNAVDEKKTEKAIPKSEEVGGSSSDGPELKGDALDIYNDLKDSGKMSDEDLMKTRKELAKVR